MIYLVLWLVCAAISGLLYRSKGLPVAGGLLLGGILGPLGLLLSLFVRGPSTPWSDRFRDRP